MTKLITVWAGFDYRKTKVDDEDYEKLSKIRWYLNPKRDKLYIACSIKQQIFYMHRMIMNADESIQVDHKNGDSLDNRKKNLRLATNIENNRNKDKQNGYYSSQYKGVSWDRERQIWESYLGINKRKIFLGRFKIEEDAARAYNEKAKIEFGEFAWLNKI